MQKVHRAAAALLLLGAVGVGCARQSPTPPPPAQTPPAQSPPVQTPPAEPPSQGEAPQLSPRERALERMAAGDYKGAVPLWKEAIAQEATAGNWNDLSYTYLLLHQWEEALAAAQTALKLQEKHRGALYNAGVAHVELKQYEQALYHLYASAALQPERHEPHLALARAHAERSSYALAAHHIGQAERLGARPEALKPLAEQTAQLKETGLTAPATCTVKHEAPPYTLCFTGKGPAITELYAGETGRPQTRISLGRITVEDRIHTIALPGGATGFLVPGAPSGAHVSGALEFRLFALSPTGVYQVVFTGNLDQFLLPTSDFLRSSGWPEIEGERLIASYGSDASREAGVVVVTRRLLPDQTALTLSLERIARDPNK